MAYSVRWYPECHCLGNIDVPSTIEVPFASPKHAVIAKQVIEVDPELQPQAVKRELTVENEKLVACVYVVT